jgi:UDP-glucose 4-epimerase
MVFLSSGGTMGYWNPKMMPGTKDHPTGPTTSYAILNFTTEKYIGMFRELYDLEARVLRVANAHASRPDAGRESWAH